MENLIFLLSESWSSVAADRLFSVFGFLGEAGSNMAGNAADSADSQGLNLTNTNFFRGVWSALWPMLRVLGATAFVAFLAWYATKKIAGAQGGFYKSKNLSLVESVNVGGQAVVRLVKAGDKYLVIGVTRERVTLLAEIDKEQINEPEPANYKNLNTPFGKVLSKYFQPKSGDEGKDEGTGE